VRVDGAAAFIGRQYTARPLLRRFAARTRHTPTDGPPCHPSRLRRDRYGA